MSVLRPATLFKKRLQHRCFPMNFAIIFYTFFTKHVRMSDCAIYNYSLTYSYNFITIARTIINTAELLLRTCRFSKMEHFCKKVKLLFAIKHHYRCAARSHTILGGLKSLRIPFQANKNMLNNMKAVLYPYF